MRQSVEPLVPLSLFLFFKDLRIYLFILPALGLGCGMWASPSVEHRLSAWGFVDHRIEPVSLRLEGRALTSGPPGKSLLCL